jgi:acetylornithine deacetylase/succinyl-diaminopimelate desuccinylase-like protein
MLDKVLSAVDSRKSQSVDTLKQFLSIPSVSTKPEHKADMVRCAEWVRAQVARAGFDAKVMPTAGHPVVVATNEHKPDRPTVLFYGHYDVQPPEPLELWTSPPFEPTVRKDDAGFDALFARGAVDDKGQVWCHIEAAQCWKDAAGGMPVNVTMLIEGEEEIGSENLEKFVSENREMLRADVAVISDTGQFARGVPAITYGLRGLCYMEVFLTGPSHDLHSGMYGGAVTNPANALCALVASLKTPDGHVNIPDFYDDVVALTREEKKLWDALPFDEKDYLRDLGVDAAPGEPGYSNLARRWGRPTCDVNGITTGYQGHGAKTVIPSKASAKVSMRLVPNQDPAKVRDAFERALRDRCPPGIKVEFKNHGLAPAALVPMDSQATRLAAEAVELGFGKLPTFMREGGSIPVVGLIKKVLGIDTLLVGFGLPDDRVHSPNEKMDLDALHRGTRTAAALYERLAQLR